MLNHFYADETQINRAYTNAGMHEDGNNTTEISRAHIRLHAKQYISL